MRRLRVRRVPVGTLELLLNLTNRHVHAQLVNRAAGRVLLSAHTTEPVRARRPPAARAKRPRSRECAQGIRSAISSEAGAHLESYATANVRAAQRVGEIFSERAVAKGVDTVLWEAPGKYHGKIKAFIDAIRASGIRTLRPYPHNTPGTPDIKN